MPKFFCVVLSTIFISGVWCHPVFAVWEDDGVFTTNRLSATTDNSEVSGDSGSPSLSADGRYVAFLSSDGNLVAGDTNKSNDVFVKDRVSGEVTLVSNALGKTTPSIAGADEPSLSANGRIVVFSSRSDDLVADDKNGHSDVFVKYLDSGTTKLVSNVRNTTASGTGDSFQPVISADGRYVAFSSLVGNLVLIDMNNEYDVFVKDLTAGITRLVSETEAPRQGNKSSFAPSISANGQHVAFASAADNLVAGDANSRQDVFVKDLNPGGFEPVRLVSNETGKLTPANDMSNNPSISADGKHVVFVSQASNLVTDDRNAKLDVFVKNLDSEAVQLASNALGATTSGNGDSIEPSISANGQHVAFRSASSDLVSSDRNKNLADVFVKNMTSSKTTIVSRNSIGIQGNNLSFSPSFSPDGRSIAFSSIATNLAGDDDFNGAQDIFSVSWNEQSATPDVKEPVTTPVVPPVVSGSGVLSGVGGLRVELVGRKRLVRVSGGLVCGQGVSCGGKVSVGLVVPGKSKRLKSRIVSLLNGRSVSGKAFSLTLKPGAGVNALRKLFGKKQRIKITLRVTSVDQTAGAKPIARTTSVSAKTVKR